MSAAETLAENTFLQVELLVSRECLETLLEILWELETFGCEETDEGGQVRLAAYFPACNDEERLNVEQRILEETRKRAFEPSELSLNLVQFSVQEWLRRYTEHFKAFAVGSSYYIYPSWEAPSPAYRINLQIDPGHAFGTGTHESTQLCLLALETTAPDARSLLDLGTGSGILVMAATKLNPKLRALALDIDPLAVEAAQQNFRKNGTPVGGLVAGGPAAIASQFDLVVANLTAVILQDLAPEIRRLAREYLIVSGFTFDQGPAVLETLEEGFELIHSSSRNDWLCYKLKAW